LFGVRREGRESGADLAYLASLQPDQARARRMVHDAGHAGDEDGGFVGASRREGRRERRGEYVMIAACRITDPAVNKKGNEGFTIEMFAPKHTILKCNACGWFWLYRVRSHRAFPAADRP
jgi:hypothetical protein